MQIAKADWQRNEVKCITIAHHCNYLLETTRDYFAHHLNFDLVTKSLIHGSVLNLSKLIGGFFANAHSESLFSAKLRDLNPFIHN